MNLASDLGFQSLRRAGGPSRKEPTAKGAGMALSLTGMGPGPALSSVPREWTSFIQEHPLRQPRATTPGSPATGSLRFPLSPEQLVEARALQRVQRGIEEISGPPSVGRRRSSSKTYPSSETHPLRPASSLFQIPPAWETAPRPCSPHAGGGSRLHCRVIFPNTNPPAPCTQPFRDPRRLRIDAHSPDPPRHLAPGLL